MQARTLAVVTALNVCVLLGSALLFYRMSSQSPPGAVGALSPATASVAVTGESTKPEAEPDSEPPGIDMRFSALVAEVFNLRGEVDALRSELQRANAGGESEVAVPSPQLSAATEQAAGPSVSEEFLVASGNGDGLENISTAFTGADAQGMELLSSSCQGNMCRVSYELEAGGPGQRQLAVATLAQRIAENVGADVDMVFAREGGESVLYIKRVN